MKVIQPSIDHTLALLSLLSLACGAVVPGDAQSRDVAATASLTSSAGSYCVSDAERYSSDRVNRHAIEPAKLTILFSAKS